MLTVKTQNQSAAETDCIEDLELSDGDDIPYVNNYQEFLRHSKSKFNEDMKRKAENSPLKITNFELVKTIGTGSFGRVVIAKLKNSTKVFAIKIIPKKKVVMTGQVKHILNERNILRSIHFPFIIHLETSFLDSTFLYLVMPYINGGELFFHLRHLGKMNELNARFYAGQICLALEFLHYLKIIYRDLKPENLVFDSNGDLKFVDFGFAKVVKSRAWTLCGTPDYIAPEMLLNRGYSFSVDVWSFGVLLFELNAGQPPFRDKNTLYLYEKILKAKYTLPSQFSAELKDLISKMLVLSTSLTNAEDNEPSDDLVKEIEGCQDRDIFPYPYIHDFKKLIKEAKESFPIEYNNKTKNQTLLSQLKITHFHLIRTLGKGSFGRVILVKFKKTYKHFALKLMPKNQIYIKRQLQHVLNERDILRSISFPFVIPLISSFQDTTNLYLLMPYLKGGELFYHLRNSGKLLEWNAKYYAGQVCLGLEFLHHLNIIYRDLKPENLVLDSNGDVKLIDFGFSKIIDTRAWSLCGTPEYMAPEMISQKGYSFTVDIWALGILIYELNFGTPPFRHPNTIILFDKISQGTFTLPSSFSDGLKDLLKQILVVSVSKRICGPHPLDKGPIKKHRWFKDINWDALLNRTMTSPFKSVVSKKDQRNFERFFEDDINIEEVDDYGTFF